MYLIFNKNFNLAKFPLWDMFLYGIEDSDGNDHRFDSNESPAWLMLFPFLRTVFYGRKENFFEKEKALPCRVQHLLWEMWYSLVSAGVNLDSLTSLLEFQQAPMILEWVRVYLEFHSLLAIFILLLLRLLLPTGTSLLACAHLSNIPYTGSHFLAAV